MITPTDRRVRADLARRALWVLRAVATRGSVITYAELGWAINTRHAALDDRYLRPVLFETDRLCTAQGLPRLVSLVVDDDGHPEPGLAEALGLSGDWPTEGMRCRAWAVAAVAAYERDRGWVE